MQVFMVCPFLFNISIYKCKSIFENTLNVISYDKNVKITFQEFLSKVLFLIISFFLQK